MKKDRGLPFEFALHTMASLQPFPKNDKTKE